MHKIGRAIMIWTTMIAASAGVSAKAQEQDAVFNACLAPATSRETLENKRKSCSAVIERKEQVAAKLIIAHSARGWIAFSNGEYPNAIADFNSALAMNANFDWALAGRAAAFLNSDQSDRALSDYDQLIAMHPANAGLFVGRGDAYNNLKDYAHGIADFDHALALDPKNDEAMNDRAWALVRQGKYTEAMEGYDGALQIAKELRGLVLSNRCEANAMAGAIDAALMDCDAALAIAPENADYLQMRGFAKFKGERYAAAIADYDAALRVDPKHTFALFQRGVAQLKLGQGDAGQSDITTAEQIQPKVRAGLAELGITAPGKQ